MRKSLLLHSAALLIVGVLCASAAMRPALAVDAGKSAEPHSAVSDIPESMTETYADWVLICNTPSAGQICEADTTVSTGGQSPVVARVAFGRPGKDKPIRIVMVLPVNLLIAPGVKFDAEPGKSLVTLAVRSCSAGGCLAEGDVTSEQVRTFRKRSGPGQIELSDAAGRPLALGISFRGLDQALEALSKK